MANGHSRPTSGSRVVTAQPVSPVAGSSAQTENVLHNNSPSLGSLAAIEPIRQIPINAVTNKPASISRFMVAPVSKERSRRNDTVRFYDDYTYARFDSHLAMND